jgi:Uma2 family endonuclease
MVAVAQQNTTAVWVTAEEWDALEVPGHYRAEIIQGELVLSPSASRLHQRSVRKLILILDKACPSEFEVFPDLEWRLDREGFVAQAPRPDILVAPKNNDPIHAAPLLAVEILSPSDTDTLTYSPMTRRDGKIRDYQSNGLRYYLEVAPGPAGSGDDVTVTLYDLVENSAEASRGTSEFITEVPFPFRFVPNDLVNL